MNLNIWGDFQICISVSLRKKIILKETQIVKSEMFICEINTIIILICRKLESVGALKTKLPSPNL